MTEEELQSLDSMELKDQIEFQELTTIVTNQDADFYVKEELEELQLLEGRRNKLQLLESTELAHGFEDPCFLCCVLSAQFAYQNLIFNKIAKITFLIMGLRIFLKQQNLSQLDDGLSRFSCSKSK